MTTASTNSSAAMIGLVVTAIIAITGWTSYFFARQDAAQFQKQVEEISSKPTPQAEEQKQAALPMAKKAEKNPAPKPTTVATPKPIAKVIASNKPAAKSESPVAPRKYNKLVMAERKKALKERDHAQARIGTLLKQKESVLKEKESAVKKGEQLKVKLAKAAADVEELKKSVEMLRQKEADRFEQLRQQLEQELAQKQVTISQLKDRMTVVNVTAEILFSSGSAILKPKGQEVLDLIAETLNKHPDRMISIEGHTDNVPIAGNYTYPTNWELSSARSAAAVRYLEEKAGVESKRMQVVGHGETRPATSNDTEEGRAVNRRIEIILLPPLM